MLRVLRALLERFWVWMGGEVPETETGVAVEPGPGQLVYVAQPGDTLGSIARRFSTSIWILAGLNDLDDHRSIRVGQRLLVPRPGAPRRPSPPSVPEPAPEQSPVEPEPGPFIYIVQTGDTLSAIAWRFGVAATALVETNQLADPNLVWPGQRLLIPGPESWLELETSPRPLAEPAPESPPPESEPIALPLPEPAPELPSALELPPAPEPLPRPPQTSSPSIPWPDDAVCAIYVPYFAIGQEAYRRSLVDMLTNSQINALVIDVKGENGLISYPTRVTLAHDIGAAQPTAHDFDELMDFFKANNIYTIARMVVFRDHPLAAGHPQWAAQGWAGEVWRDGQGGAWVDPFVQAVWEYNSDLAEEAVERGFDEIQLDYVRFPTNSQEGPPCFSQSLSRDTRVAAVTAFLSYVRGRLASSDVRVAANVLGYTCWREDDALIGQEIKRMAHYLHVLCPLLYPSSFEDGIPGYQYAIDHPYETVYRTMKQAARRAEPSGCRVRPWIQDFPHHYFDGHIYGPVEVRAQMQGSFDGGGIGYMAWNPEMKYTKSAYF